MSIRTLPCLVVTLSIFTTGCSSDSTGAANPSKILEQASTNNSSVGNGDYYGGKLSQGTYIRELPPLSCASPVDHLGKIVVSPSKITGSFVDPNSCELTNATIPIASLEFSQYKQNVIGLVEGIYQKTDEQPTDDSVEAWCRREGSQSKTGFDVEIRADYSKNKFFAHVTSAELSSKGIIKTSEYKPLELEERRVEMFERVRYRADDFEIEIRTNSLDAWSGTMQADFRYRKNGYKDDMKIYCRLGGKLDVRSIDRGYNTALNPILHNSILQVAMEWKDTLSNLF